jgi:DNA-binding transcriptional ArsR family regulator
MIVEQSDDAVSSIAAAIGEPARSRMLYCLMDGHARTSTELAVVADVTPSTASVHLQRLKTERLVKVMAQGKHRYYSLDGSNVAAALEALRVLAGTSGDTFVTRVPNHLRLARTCYDHMAGSIGVAVFDHFKGHGWLSTTTAEGNACELTPSGTKACEALGINLESMRAVRRRFAYACLDWSERRPHIGGALGAALLSLALDKKWVARDLVSRALTITRVGRREMAARLGFVADQRVNLRSAR